MLNLQKKEVIIKILMETRAHKDLIDHLIMMEINNQILILIHKIRKISFNQILIIAQLKVMIQTYIVQIKVINQD